MHRALDQRDGQRPTGAVDALLGDDGGDLVEERVEVVLALLVRDLQQRSDAEE